MQIWKTDYDVCAMFIILAFWMVYFGRKRFPTFAGKMFGWMTIDLFFCSLIEVIEINLEYYHEGTPSWLLSVLMCSYLIFICLLCFAFSIYVFLLSRKGKYTERRWYWYAGYTPALILLILIALSPKTHLIVYYVSGVFNRGPLYYGIFVVIALYILFTISTICYYRKNFLNKNRLMLYVIIAFVSLAVVVQSFFPTYLISNFCAAFGLICFYIVQQSNYDMTDVNSNLYGRASLSVYINEQINSQQKFNIIAIVPNELTEMIHKRGTYYGDNIIRNIADKLAASFGMTGAFSLNGGRFVVITQENGERANNEVRRLFEEGILVDGEEFTLTVNGVSLKYPGDFATPDDALNLCERGLDIAAKSNKGTIVTMDNFEAVRDSLVAKMKEDQLLLEEQRREAERQKAEAEQGRMLAEQADKAKSTFLAHMSHEIRTPLTTIMGMTEIVLRGRLEDNVRDTMEKIYYAGNSLLQIINDILDFSKIEAGKFDIIDEEYNPAATLDAVINVLRVRCDSKPIEIVTEIDPSTPARLKGDETRIRQVLYNLVSNASKYTSEGYITFREQWLPQTQELLVSVRDTGRGIKSGDIEHLFDSFTRFDEQADKSIEGTGLGLAITKRIVGLMHGDLTVESVYGKGSTFTVRLRQEVVDSATLGECTETEHTAFHGSDMRYFVAHEARVLVVDDNSFNRMIAAELIRPHGIKVDLAEGGRECLELVKKNSYDLIFLDHMMPGMDGVETLTELKHMKEFVIQEIPVIAFSANAVSGMKEKFRNDGFIDFLSKPISVESLESMLVNYLPAEKIQVLSKAEFEKMMSERDVAMAGHVAAAGGMAGYAVEGEESAENVRQSFTGERKTGSGSDTEKAGAAGAGSGRGDNMTSDTYELERIGIEGMDTQTALANMAGSVDRFFMMVEVILTDKPARIGELEKAFGAKDAKNYSISAHAMKSNLATLGLPGPSEQAKKLEFAGKEENLGYIEENHAQFVQLYSQICDALERGLADYRAWKNGESSGAAVPAGPSAAAGSTSANEGQPSGGGAGQPSGADNQAAAAFKSLAESMPEFRDTLNCLELLIREFEYDTAIKLTALFIRLSADPEEQKKLKAISAKLDMFDYDGAIAIIRE